MFYTGIRPGTDEIKREMERIDAEKSAILSQLARTGILVPKLPRPVPTSKVVNVKKSDFPDSNQRRVDQVNDKRSKIDCLTASKILPGAKSFEDIQAYLNAAKKEKIEKLKKKNKAFIRNDGRRW